MEKYEVAITILNKDYIDSLIVALVRQGYSVYLNEEDNVVCFEATDEDVIKLKKA